MTTAIKRRRGTTSQHSTFTGLEGELTIDTTKDTVVVHDGATAGGFPLAKESGSAIAATTLSASSTATLNTLSSSGATITGGSINGTTVGASTASTGAFTSLSASGAFSANGGATLGDASGDALTINSSAVSIPNGLNFDSNTLVIDATNNRVGVGVASPTATVHISAPDGTAPLTLNSAGGSDSTRALNFNIGGDNYGKILVPSASGGAMAFWTGGANAAAERVRITNAGNVGIGTSSPNAALFVAKQSASGTSSVVGVGIGSSSSTAAIELFGSASGAGIIDFAPADGATDFKGRINYDLTNNYFRFYTNATERMRLDSSGNLGLGVTPSAWGSSRWAIELGANSYVGSSTQANIFCNNYRDGSGFVYKANGNATLYQQNNTGQHLWYNAPSGTAGNAITFTQAMTLDASGNLGVGTTSPSSYNSVARQLVISNASNSTGMTIRAGGGGAANIIFSNAEDTGVDGLIQYETASNFMRFDTSGAERMRIDTSGNLLVGQTTNANSNRFALAGSGGTADDFTINTNSSYSEIQTFNNKALYLNRQGNNVIINATSGSLLVGTTTAPSIAGAIHVSNASGHGLQITNTTGSKNRRMYISSGGILYFWNGTNEAYLTDAGAWTNASDARLKKNVRNIEYGLDTVLSTQPRHYERNDVDGTHIGFVAQELQNVIPEVVSGDPERQLGVDYGSLVAVAFKAIQEQQAIINDLKARIETLESK
jgi:hypothetical protein